MSNEFKLSANDISALKMLGLGDNIANIEKQIGKMPSVLRRQKENEINKLYKNEPRKAKKALAEYDYNVALNSGDADAIKQSGKNLAKAEQEAQEAQIQAQASISEELEDKKSQKLTPNQRRMKPLLKVYAMQLNRLKRE